MNYNDTIKAEGNLNVLVKNELTGEVNSYDFKNLVVQVGKNYIASRMVGTTQSAMTHMAVGTGTSQPVAADTTLGAELAGARVALSSQGASTNKVTYIASFAAGVGTGALTEAGIFNSNTNGTMLCRTVFSVINKGPNDSITITWEVTIS